MGFNRSIFRLKPFPLGNSFPLLIGSLFIIYSYSLFSDLHLHHLLFIIHWYSLFSDLCLHHCLSTLVIWPLNISTMSCLSSQPIWSLIEHHALHCKNLDNLTSQDLQYIVDRPLSKPDLIQHNPRPFSYLLIYS